MGAGRKCVRGGPDIFSNGIRIPVFKLVNHIGYAGMQLLVYSIKALNNIFHSTIKVNKNHFFILIIED